MAKAYLTPSPTWGKHLKPYWKRLFWSRERQAADRLASIGDDDIDLTEMPETGEDWFYRARVRNIRKPYGIVFVRHSPSGRTSKWHVYYKTKRHRDEALRNARSKMARQSFVYWHSVESVDRP